MRSEGQPRPPTIRPTVEGRSVVTEEQCCGP